MRSSPRGATPSPPPPRGRLSVTSRRSSATLPWTSSRRCPLLPPPPPWRSPTSCPTARSSPSATRGSGAPRPSSSPASWAWRPAASTRPPTTPSRSATLTSGRTCTPTPSCPEAPPCTPVSLTACRRRSPPWLPSPSRSRSSLRPRGSTPSGSEAPSWLPSPPSSRCGSPSRSTTSAAHPSSTASASKMPTSTLDEKQHTGSYHRHLHLLVSGVFPSFLLNHTSIVVWSTDILQLHSTLYYIPSSILTLSMFTKYLIPRLLCAH